MNNIVYIYSGGKILHIMKTDRDIIKSIIKEMHINANLKSLLSKNYITAVKHTCELNDIDSDIALIYYSSLNKSVYNETYNNIKEYSQLVIDNLDNMKFKNIDHTILNQYIDNQNNLSEVRDRLSESMATVHVNYNREIAKIAFEDSIEKENMLIRAENRKTKNIDKTRKRYEIDMSKLLKEEQLLIK